MRRYPASASLPPRNAVHAIETLMWQSRTDDGREAALAHQARLSAFLNGPGQATVSRVFSRMSAPDEVWQLDRLEIDIGPLLPEGSFSQWADILEQQLVQALLQARQSLAGNNPGVRALPSEPVGDAVLATVGQAPRPSDHQGLEHFLFYLQHGHLPWSRSAIAGRGLSVWLALLARRTGPRLWGLLRELRPASYVLARLSQITPYQGLQALVGVRHRELADSLDALDAQLLIPLQARGRLSAYQVQQLQQAWRVTAFQTLWHQRGAHLSADDVQRLQRELGAALTLQLGRGGLGVWRPASYRARHLAAGTTGRSGVDEEADFALESVLLTGVLDAVAPRWRDTQRRTAVARNEGRAAAARKDDLTNDRWRPDAMHTRNPLDAALHRLTMALDGSVPLEAPLLELLLQDLHRREPDALRTHLRALVLHHGLAGQWLTRHGTRVTAHVMRALGPRRSATHVADHGAHWAESLRQFALAALARGAGTGGARPGGLSALQAWLAAFSLQQLALGERAPTTRQGWERLWQRALAAWQQGGRRQRPLRLAQAVSRHPPALTPQAIATSSLGGAPVALRALLAPHMRRRHWRWHVAARWRTARKVELFALLDIARGGTSTMGWSESVHRWQWVADAVATCIARFGELSGVRSAAVACDTATDVYRWHETWLWEVAIRWAWRERGATKAPASLYGAWCQAAKASVGALGAATAPSATDFPVTAETVAAALGAMARPIRTPAAHQPARMAPAAAIPAGRRVRTPSILPMLRRRKAARMTAPLRWQALHRVVSRAERLAHVLALPQQRAVRRDWMARQQVAGWLAEPALCTDWLAATRAPERWELLATLFPREIASLRRSSATLQSAAAAMMPEQPVSARQESHWRFLANHALVGGLPLTPGCLTRRHAMHLYREHGRRGATLPQWISHVARWFADWSEGTGVEGRQRARLTHRPAPWLRSALQALRRAPDDVEQWEARHVRSVRKVGPQSRSRHISWQGARGSQNAIDEASLPELAALARLGESDTHYVADAGLVLLATYSQMLFARLGLLEDRTMRDSEASSRAVRCLAWLVHGHNKASEPECVLGKLLCGMQLAEPLVGDATLDESTRQLLDGLLGAVIANWPALGATSHTGLRETFLQREGRLTRERNEAGFHWRLVVKPGPFDMLLDRLPWSISTIKLPWMGEVLHVDWR